MLKEVSSQLVIRIAKRDILPPCIVHPKVTCMRDPMIGNMMD